jgi:hypothetical protein
MTVWDPQVRSRVVHSPILAILSLTGIPHLGHHFFVNVRSNTLSLNYFSIQVAH